MRVEVKLVGRETRSVELPAGSSVVEILRELGIPREIVLVKANGRVVPEEERLSEGDVVEIFQVVTGG